MQPVCIAARRAETRAARQRAAPHLAASPARAHMRRCLVASRAAPAPPQACPSSSWRSWCTTQWMRMAWQTTFTSASWCGARPALPPCPAPTTPLPLLCSPAHRLPCFMPHTLPAPIDGADHRRRCGGEASRVRCPSPLPCWRPTACRVALAAQVTRGLKPTPYQNPNITLGSPTIVIIPEHKRAAAGPKVGLALCMLWLLPACPPARLTAR